MNIGRREKRRDTALQMAPMIDCVFLLLIFFMVATVMRIPPPFQVDLPDSKERQEFPRKKFNLHISSDGQMAVDDQVMPSLDDLSVFLNKNQTRIQVLIIKADKNAKHGIVIDAMERAKQQGIETLAIAIREGEFRGEL